MTEPAVSYDVRVYKIEVRKGLKRTTYRVRWTVAGRVFADTFTTRKLAESRRAEVLQAASKGEAFDKASGLPRSETKATQTERLWVQLAREFIDSKWDESSPRHRKSTVEGLVTLTCALVRDEASPPAGRCSARR